LSIGLLAGQFFQEPFVGLIFSFGVVLSAFFARMNPIVVLVLSLPFDFLVTQPFLATISVGHLALPVTLSFLILSVIRKPKPPRPTLIPSAYLGWASLTVISLLISASFSMALVTPTFFVHALKVGVALSFGLVAATLWNSHHVFGLEKRDVLRAFLFSAHFQFVLGCAGWFFAFATDAATSPFTYGGLARLSGTFDNPNNFAVFQLVACGFAIAYSSATNGKLPGLLVMVPALATNFSGSLAAQIAIIVLGLSGLAFSLTKEKRFDASFLTLTLVSVLSSGLVGFRTVLRRAEAKIQDVTTGPVSEISVSSPFQGDIRFSIWQEAYELFLSSPILGIGGGNFQISNSFKYDAHNTHIQLLVEVGAVGYFVFIAPAVIALFLLGRLPLDERAIMLAWFAGLVFGLGNSIANSPSIWLLFGMAITIIQIHRREAVP
jgi:hypothetical protein